MAKIRVPYDLNGNPLAGTVVDGRVRDGQYAGGHVCNGFEGTLRQTDVRILSAVHIEIPQFPQLSEWYNYYGVDAQNRPYYVNIGQDSFLLYNIAGGHWQYSSGSLAAVWVISVSTSLFPTQGVYTDEIYEPITVSFNCWWIEDGEYVRRTYADFLARSNVTDKQVDQWKKDSSCIVNESIQYPQDTVFTPAQHNQAIRWAEKYTEECGAGCVEFPT